jgi:ATP-dependent Clp protease ATP-binding subunit ClpC
VLFAPLLHDEVREIARHYLDQVKLTLAQAGKTIQIEDAALEHIVVHGYNIAFGARFLKRYIDEHVKLPISATWKDASHFDVVVKENALVVEPAPAKVMSADEAMAYGDVA